MRSGGSSDEAQRQLNSDVAPATDPLEAEADQVARDTVGTAPAGAPSSNAATSADDQTVYEVENGLLPDLYDGGGAANPSPAPAAPDTPDQNSAAAGAAAASSLQSKGIQGKGPTANQAAIAAQVQSDSTGGAPLQGSSRSFFEPRLGTGLDHVRVHDDARADSLNQSLQARAFTSGSDIFFRAGEYEPDSLSGRSLLAHELAHVVQQGGPGPHPKSLTERTDALTPRWARADPGPIARSPGGVQRQPKPKTPGSSSSSEYIEFSVFVPADYQDAAQAERLFERTAYGRETNSTWNCGGKPCDITTLRGHQVTFGALRSKVEALTDPASLEHQKEAKKQLAGKGSKEQKAITDEVDKRYAAASGDKPGTKIAKKDEGKGRQWDQKLDEVMSEGAKLEQLPAAVKDLLTGKTTMAPKDYPRLLKIADKLARLSPQDLAAFKWLTVRATDNLDLFEKSVDMFIARKAEIVTAMQAQQGQPPAQPDPSSGKKDDLQAAFDKKWQGLDEKALATMSESDRYALAQQKTNEMTGAQLRYMKDHPGETLKDFAESATLLNTPETFKGIGKDLAEAADGDANTWARFAGGAGAGAKLSGWIVAVAGVLYVASWLTGIGELATIAAVAGYALAATITLSAAERDLRVKAASQTKDPTEFKRQIQLAAAAQANVIISLAMIAIAAALHFVGKTAFPKTVAKLRTSMLNFRERIRLRGSIYELKPSIKTEMGAHQAEVATACDAAKQQAVAMAKEVAGMSEDGFVDRLESGNGDFLDQTKAAPEQRVNYRELTKSAEGRAAIEEYRKALVDILTNEVPAEIDKIQQDYAGKIDDFLKDVDAAQNHDQLGEAADKFAPALTDEHLKSLMSGEQDKLTKQKLADAADALEKKAQQLQQAQAKAPPNQPTVPAQPADPAKSGNPPTTPDQPQPAHPTDPSQPSQPSQPTVQQSPADVAAQATKTELTNKASAVSADLAPLRKVRSDLNALIKKGRDADAAVSRLNDELRRATDADKRASLKKDHDDAVLARKQAADDLKSFREQHDLSGDSELDYQINALEKDLNALNDALNPKPAVGVDETKPLGGRYYDVPAQGGEVNHMPADSANPDLSTGKGPSIRMDIPDHYATKSWGSGKAAVKWRAAQAKLISEGKFMEALEMDINDVRSTTGAKYEKGIQQMLDYVAKSAEIKAMSKNSTVTVTKLRRPSVSVTP